MAQEIWSAAAEGKRVVGEARALHRRTGQKCVFRRKDGEISPYALRYLLFSASWLLFINESFDSEVLPCRCVGKVKRRKRKRLVDNQTTEEAIGVWKRTRGRPSHPIFKHRFTPGRFYFEEPKQNVLSSLSSIFSNPNTPWRHLSDRGSVCLQQTWWEAAWRSKPHLWCFLF